VGHADEVTTNVHTRRVFASVRDGAVSIGWDYPGRSLLQVRILRSGAGYAEGPEPAPDQRVVYEDVTGSFREAAPAQDAPRYYTVFARQPGEAWLRWGEFTTAPATAPAGWARLRALLRPWRRPTGLPILAALCLIGVAALLAGLTAGAGAAPKAADAASAQAAVAAASADPQVAAVVHAAGDPVPRVTAWADGRGVSVLYQWPAARAVDVAAVWPLVSTDDADAPTPPYTQHDLRLRLSELSGLRVDVLNDGSRVLQLMPAGTATRFTLHEQTWPPFSWIPWFTQRPYVLLPVFLIIAVLVIWRAWLRSRAWNRRLPSMTRHDRQFIGRLTVLLFLAASFAWLVYEAVVAAKLPSADPNAVAAADLAALPVLLIPPCLLIAGLVLELSWQSHRFAWGLLAVLAAAASAYELATAIIGTAGNLNLSAFILMAILALIATPRAFSRGKMGWSRSFAPRYG
jgi:hypothetical protein